MSAVSRTRFASVVFMIVVVPKKGGKKGRKTSVWRLFAHCAHAQSLDQDAMVQVAENYEI
jgi:hypothetical protein